MTSQTDSLRECVSNLVSGTLWRSLGHRLGMRGKTGDVTAELCVCVCARVRERFKQSMYERKSKMNQEKSQVSLYVTAITLC